MSPRVFSLLALGFALAPVPNPRGQTSPVESGCSEIGNAVPSWSPDTLISIRLRRGRGNSALVVAPDGTSIMIDAGAIYGEAEVSAPAMPDDSRRPGEWIARYAQRQLRATGRVQLDYFVVTHLHRSPGRYGPNTPRSERDPSYVLTGMTDVAELVPIRHRDRPWVFPRTILNPLAMGRRSALANSATSIASAPDLFGRCDAELSA